MLIEYLKKWDIVVWINISTKAKNKYKNSKLERKMGLGALIGLGVGATVGSGIFSTISTVANTAGSSLFLVIAFAVATLLQIPGSFCYAELASAYPEDGGHYVYFREAGFKMVTFIIGWITFLALDAPALSVMSLAIVNYLQFFFEVDPMILRFVAIAIIFGFACMHIRSVKVGSTVQATITFIKIVPFILIIGVGVFFVNPDLLLSPEPISQASNMPSQSLAIMPLFSAIALSFFSCDGVFAGCYVSGEIKNPKRTLPLGLVLSVLIIMLLYVGLTTTATGLMSVDEIASSTAPIADMAGKIPVIGVYAGPIIAVVAIIVIMGTISSCMLYMPRFEFAMARDGLFFPIFAKVHRKFSTPHRAITIFCAYAILLVFFGDLSSLLGALTIIILLKNSLTFATIFILRRKEGYNPTYKAPGNWLMPVISVVSTMCLLVFAIITASAFQLLFNTGIILLGIVAYFI